MNPRLRHTVLRTVLRNPGAAGRPVYRCRSSMLPSSYVNASRSSSTAQTTPAFPPQDYTKYRWQNSAADPLLHERYAAGAERFVHDWAQQHDGQGSFLLRFDTAFVNPVSAHDLLDAARQAWLTLRFDTPVIATTTKSTSNGDSMITYRAAADQAEAEAWASRTVQLVEPAALGDEHDVLNRWRVWEDGGDQAMLILVPRSDKRCEIVLLVSHAWTDGGGAKVVGSKFLAILARYLGEPSLAGSDHAQLRWGQESSNLLPAYPEIVSDSEKLSGPEYDATLTQILQDFGTSLPHALTNKSHAITDAKSHGYRIEHKFSEEQTRRIMKYAKARGLTVNHLANAAAYLSVLHENPDAATEHTFLVGNGAANARSRLRAPFNERNAYAGCCLGSTALPVRLADFQHLREDEHLVAVAHILKREYAKQKAYPALLGVTAQQIDLITEAEKTQPSPLPSIYFYGDGVADRDLDVLHVDDKGVEVLSVTDFSLFIRYTQPFIVMRLQTWRGQLYMNFFYNEAHIPRHVIQNVKDDVLRMLDVSDSDSK